MVDSCTILKGVNPARTTLLPGAAVVVAALVFAAVRSYDAARAT